MNTTQRIFAFHLLNDRSGSPKVLSQLIRHWVESGKEVHLYTGVHHNGFLSDLPGVQYINGWYQFQPNPWLRLLYYTLSQGILILKMWPQIHKNDIVYVNTVLPFGAAVLGRLKGAKVIYHIHESTVNPAVLKWFLFKIVQYTAHKIINVSRYVQQSHGINSAPNVLIYNTIDEPFLSKVIDKKPSARPRNVLMVCSLKAYKGIIEFVQMAQDHPEYSFRLVLNATRKEVDSYFQDHTVPPNIELYAAQKNMHPFYHWADVVVNLSRPDGWIETFGLTIIEGMAYGLPAIVPPVGGIQEVIEEGATGYSVDSRDRQALNATLKQLLEDSRRYHAMSLAARKRLAIFTQHQVMADINSIL